MSEPQRDALTKLLAGYEQRRSEIDVLIAALRKELGLSAQETQAPPHAQGPQGGGSLAVDDMVRPGDFFGMTQTQAAHAFLEKRGRQAASLQEIAQALYRGKATESLMSNPSQMRNLSSVLSRSGEFVSIAKGRWGLVEWYPNRAVKRSRKAEKENSSTEIKADTESGGDSVGTAP